MRIGKIYKIKDDMFSKKHYPSYIIITGKGYYNSHRTSLYCPISEPDCIYEEYDKDLTFLYSQIKKEFMM